MTGPTLDTLARPGRRRRSGQSVDSAIPVVTRADRPLPAGFPVSIRPDVRALDSGRVLVGGRPPRVARMPAAGAPSTWLIDAGMADPVREALPRVEPAGVTVVVPVRDRLAQVERLLTALGADCRVIVVDDASRDRQGIAAVARRHGAALVRQDVNSGPAGARNAGLAHATTPVIALVDSDAWCSAVELLELARHFHDPLVAAVAPRIVTSAASPRGWGRYEAARSALDLGPVGGVVRPATSVPYVPTTCLLVRREALPVDGDVFDVDLRAGEDVDLVWRLVRSGWLVRYDPAVTVRHDHPASVLEGMARRFRYGGSAAALAERHGPVTAPAVLSPWTAPATAAPACAPVWSVAAAAASTLGAGLTALRRVRPLVGEPGAAARLSLQLAATGTWHGMAQGSALIVRHWWPITFAAALVSGRARRAATLAVAVDAAAGLARRGPVRPGLRTLLWWLAGRRLDDIAYGTGVWYGAIRHRSVAALLPATSEALRRSVTRASTTSQEEGEKPCTDPSP